MIIKTFKSLKYAFVTFIGMSLLMSCAEQAQLKPWDNTSLAKINLTFTDTDMDKEEIAGDISLDLPAALRPSGVDKYIIYWSSSAADTGKDTKLAEVSSSFSGSLLYKVPENEKIKGSFFLVYLRGANNKELWSGKSVAVDDQFKEETVDEPTIEDTPAQTELITDTPAVDQTVVAPTTDVDTPAVDESVDTKEPIVEAVTVEPTTVETATDEVTTETTDEPVVEKVVVTIENVLFEFDRSYLRSDFKEQLRKDFADLEDKGQTEVLIAGHADERGSNEYNLALGERRAYAVKRYLVSLGFVSENVRIISYGEEKPLDRGHSETSWEKNRRAESKVLDQD